jgi:HK97 gp10 family phage protein
MSNQNYDTKTMIEIFGTDQMFQLFVNLKNDIQDQIINKTFRKAARILIKDAQGKLTGVVADNPKSKYTLKKSLSATLKQFEKRIIIGTKKKYGGHLAHIFDNGTIARYYLTKSGRKHNTGNIKASHFFSSAITDTEQQIKDLISSDMLKRLNQTIKKQNKVTKTKSK